MNVTCNGFEIDEKRRTTVCGEGEVVLFDTLSEGKVTELVVDVLPKRRKGGDPSPTNICPIEGYSEMTIHHLTDYGEGQYTARLGDTIYAGTVDLLKGIATTEYAMLLIDGSKTVGTVSGHTNSFYYSLGDSCTPANARGANSIGWCSHFKVMSDVTSATFWATDMAVSYSNNALSGVRGRAIFNDSDFSSAADFGAYLQSQASNGTPVQFIFRLEEPVTFEFEPLSIRTVSGSNHLVSEDGTLHACCTYFEDNDEPTESVTMPFGCQIGCTVTENPPVEPLPVEEREPRDVCPPGFPNKWDIDDVPHEDKYCDGQGMDCVCNPMGVAVGVPCYKTIYVPDLPEKGLEGIMYVVPMDDKYAVYMWDGTEFHPVTATGSCDLSPLTVVPSTSAQDILPEGDGFDSVHVDAMPQGVLAPPTVAYDTMLGTGVIRAFSSVGVDGYVDSQDTASAFKYCTQVLPTETPKTVTPTTSEQVAVDANKWTAGQIKVGPIPAEYLIPSGTKGISANGNGIDVAAYAAVDVNVPNSYSASDEGKVVDNGALVAQTSRNVTANGTYDTTTNDEVVVNVQASGKAVQISNSNGRVNTTSYTSTGVTLTVEKSGTYDVYWSGFRSSTSGTNGTQLYRNSAAYGSAQTSFTNSYNQTIRLTNVALNQGDVLTVYARARGTSYYMCAANLTIIEV